MEIEKKLEVMKELREEYPSDMQLSEIHDNLIIKYETLENETIKNYA